MGQSFVRVIKKQVTHNILSACLLQCGSVPSGSMEDKKVGLVVIMRKKNCAFTVF